jgi:hypothetical protein
VAFLPRIERRPAIKGILALATGIPLPSLLLLCMTDIP